MRNTNEGEMQLNIKSKTEDRAPNKIKFDGLVKSLLDLFFKISDAQNSAY